MSIYTTSVLDTGSRAFEYIKCLTATASQKRFRNCDEDFLKRFTEIQRFKTDQTGITPMMGYFLFYMAAQLAPARVVSMGSHSGISTAFLLGGTLVHENGKLTCIEPDGEKCYLTQCNLMTMSGVQDRFSIIHGDPVEWATANNQPVDLLFIDVTHPMRQKADYEVIASQMLRRMAPGSIILAHDALISRWDADITAYEISLETSGRCQWHQRLPVDDTGVSLGVLQ